MNGTLRRCPVAIVAEDNFLTRMDHSELLRHHSFVVVEALDAKQALEHFDRLHHNVDLLMTDVHMDGTIKGFELARLVSVSSPRCRIMIVSAHQEPPASAMPAGAVYVLKPAADADLERALSHLGFDLGLHRSE